MGRDGEEGVAEETGGREGALGSLEGKAGHSLSEMEGLLRRPAQLWAGSPGCGG